MKYSITTAFIALLSLPALGADEIIIRAKVIESTNSIPHDIAKLAKTKGIDVLAAPEIIARTGQLAQIEIIRAFQPPTVAPSAFKSVPLGVIVRVTPHLKDGQIAFTAQLTVRELIDTKTTDTQTHAEMSSRDLYISGTPKDGEALWFHFTETRNGTNLAVWLQLKRKKSTITAIPQRRTF